MNRTSARLLEAAATAETLFRRRRFGVRVRLVLLAALAAAAAVAALAVAVA